MTNLLVGLAVAAAALVLAGCSGYRHAIFRADEKSKLTDPKYELRFVEADDEGWFWQPRVTDAGDADVLGGKRLGAAQGIHGGTHRG